MYQEKLAVAVLVNGRVLREFKDTVRLPFGTEFTIRFKNMNALRALVRMSIDGHDATEGTSIIVPGNSTVDLERFLKASNLEQGHRFKFIERTAKIEDGPRGIKVDDGLIRVEFEFEKQPAKIEDVWVRKHHFIDEWRSAPRPYYGEFWAQSKSGTAAPTKGGTLRSMGSASASLQSTTLDSFNISSNASASAASFSDEMAAPTASTSASVNDVGITVPGSISEQKFTTGAWFATDGQKHVMVLKLLGTYGDAPVAEPVTVKTKIECPTCGTKNAVGSRFCSDCGTSLVTL